MDHLAESIIIGKGIGISKFLSDNLGIKSISTKDLLNFDLSTYKTIIYTSTDPSNKLEFGSSYLEKNFRSLYYVLESNFKGTMIYISSVDSGSYEVNRGGPYKQLEEMFTPYSFSKYSAESLFLNHKSFKRCIVLRVGMLWPTRLETNFFNVVEFNNKDVTLNLYSEFYVTPYSLILKFLKNNFLNEQRKTIFGYLTSSNKLTFMKLLNMKGIFPDNQNKDKYIYKTKNKELGLLNLTAGDWFNWEEENDFNLTIAKALFQNGKEEILPLWK